MNQKRLFNEDWEFAKSTLEVADGEFLDFNTVDLPYDWLIYNTLDLYENSIGWYRKRFINANSVLLADVIYQKESQWNVYQEATYLLSKRLTGITSICFVLQKKMHIKGFSFVKKNRAFEQNMAVDCDRIYGDTFTIAEQGIEGIGNNVSLVFEQMDFTTEGTSKLVICGRSPIDKNTIHIHFEEGEESSNQLIEFTQSEGYVE